jgi:F-type H+-transporting ATPase subunit delta
MSEQAAEKVGHATVLDPGGKQLGRIYAQALLSAALKENAIDDVVDQFGALVDGLLEHPVLKEVFASPRIKDEEKLRVIDRLFANRISPLLLRFLKVVASRHRLGYLVEMSQAAFEMRDEAAGRVVAHVRTATPLTDQLRGEVVSQISNLVAREVRLRETVDPSLLGGIVVRVGDAVYDGSIAGRLQRMSKSVRATVTTRLAQQAGNFFSGEVAS